MKIAHCVEMYAPAPGGMAEVVKQLSERMTAAGHLVTVFTSVHKDRNFETLNGVQIKTFNISGNAQSGLAGNVCEYIDALRQGKFDVIAFYAAQQWTTDAALPHLQSLQSKKVFVPTGFSAFYRPEWKAYYQKMPQWMAQMDMNVFLSDNYRDAAFAKENNISNRILIPNGASREEFESVDSSAFRSAHGIDHESSLILHVGSFVSGKAQEETLRIFLKANLKNSTLLLAGHGADSFRKVLMRYPLLSLSIWMQQQFRKNKVIYKAINREETLRAFHEADFFLFPSKIECSPIVLFECMASRTPFLVTDVGNSKEIIEWSGSGWLMKTTIDDAGYSHVDIAAAALQLREKWNDEVSRVQAGKCGHSAWIQRFTWQHIADQYMCLYTQLVATK
ncbi:MAG: glycosyltransferase family 4 protein [Flavobacteriales bacterium]